MLMAAALALALAVAFAVAGRPLGQAHSVANGWVAYTEGSDIFVVRQGTEPHRAVGLPTDWLGDGGTPPLDGDGTLRSCPTFSPDGSMLAWSETARGFGGASFGANRIVVSPIDSEGNISDRPTILTVRAGPGENSAPCAEWAPDGDRLALWSSEARALQLVSLNGTAQAVLHIDYYPEFAWSPDGSALAVGTDAGVIVAPVDGGAARSLAIPAESLGFSSFEWSPDGDRIAVSWSTRDPKGSGYDGTNVAGRFIRIFRADGTVEADIAIPVDGQPYVPHPGPAWSPDGTRIAWIQRVGRLEIVVASADGSDPTVVFPTADPALTLEFGLEGWSPDGQRLLVTGVAEDPTDCGRHTLLSIAADGTSPPIVLATDVGSGCLSDVPEVSWQEVSR
jgi:Tol biopolymer transport system component